MVLPNPCSATIAEQGCCGTFHQQSEKSSSCVGVNTYLRGGKILYFYAVSKFIFQKLNHENSFCHPLFSCML